MIFWAEWPGMACDFIIFVRMVYNLNCMSFFWQGGLVTEGFFLMVIILFSYGDGSN